MKGKKVVQGARRSAQTQTAGKRKTVTTRGAKGGEVVTSLHQRILSDIQGHILSGRWAPGRRIPVEHELMEQYGCSRMTVNKALTELARAGIIERRRKVGSFVGRPQSQSAVLAIQDIKSEVDALGVPYRFEILRRRRHRATREERALLGTQEPLPVLELICRHFAKDQPFCIEYRLINLQAVAGAETESFEAVSPGAWLLRQVPWNVAEHRIGAAGAPADIASQLQVKTGTPCLIVERTTRSASSPITFVRLSYPGNLHELVATFTALGS